MVSNIFRLLSIGLIGILALTCGSKKESTASTDGFVIRSGVNVSHWLSQSDKRGDARRNYITKADLENIAAMGFDHIRLPVDEEQLWDSTGNKETEAFELLHNAIQWAIAAKLRTIVDLHIIRAHHFIADSNPLWTNPAEQEKLVNLWLQLSKELGQYPNNLVAYEILNEAVADDPEDWNKVLNKVIFELRKKEPSRVIVIGSNRWQIPSTFPDLKVPQNDPNLILSFHFYTPMALTHHLASWSAVAEYAGPVNYPGLIVDTTYYQQLSAATVETMRDYANGYFDQNILEQEMLPAIKTAREMNLPLYCGEFGVYPTIPNEIRLRWYRDICDIFKKNKIAYCHWCYKGDFPIVDEKGLPDQKLVPILAAK
jgi:endoglucanase